MSIKIIQANIQGWKTNKDEIISVATKEDADILCLQETWQKTAENTQIKGYKIIQSCREDGYGGSLIAIKGCYKIGKTEIAETKSHIQVATAEIMDLDIIVSSVYIRPGTPIATYKYTIQKIITDLRESRRCKKVLVGDFNAHHQSWGNINEDSRGELLINELNDTDLMLMHNKEPTFINPDPSKSNSAIDLTIINATMYLKAKRTVTDIQIGGSGHRVIVTEIEGRGKKRDKTVILNSTSLACDIYKMNAPEYFDLNRFTKEMTTIRKANTKTITVTPKAWWDMEVEKAYEEKKTANKNYSANRTLENEINAKRKLARFRFLKKVNKTKNWEKWLERVDEQKSSSELWRLIAKCKGSKWKNDNINAIHSDLEKAKEFMKINFPNVRQANPTMVRSNITTEEELLDIKKWTRIMESKKNTAPGMDGISYGMLKMLNEEYTDRIIKDLNERWKRGKVARGLKTIKIVAIPKQGKDLQDAKNYRPISLLPTLTKMANSAVLEVLQEYTEKHHVIPSTSFGFRKRKSIHTATNLLVNEVYKNNREGNNTGVIFVDIKSAYNCVNIVKLTRILQAYMVPEGLVNWIFNLLTNRIMEIKVGKQKVTRVVSHGLPQGDVLSPTLFNIYTNELHKVNHGGRTRVIQYADDFIIMAAGTIEYIQTELQRSLDSFTNTAKGLDMEVNREKTKLMIFPREANVDINLNGQAIEKVKEYTFLGTIIDQKLNFQKHTNAAIQKAQRKLDVMKMICNRSNNIRPEKALQVHRSIIRGSMEFGASLINNANKNTLAKIDKVLHQSLRKVTGCTRTTPINSLMALAAEIPSSIRRKYVIAKEMVKAIAYSVANRQQLANVKRSATKKRYSGQELSAIENGTLTKRIPTFVPNDFKHCDIVIRKNMPGLLGSKSDQNTQAAKQICCEYINKNAKDRPRIYTDGSLTDDKCGIGIVIQEPVTTREWAYKLERNVAISTVELAAIDRALKLAIARNVRRPIILTDSKVTCEALKNALESDIVEETICNVLSNCRYAEATIQWIPSHVGIHGNERADILAKMGTTSDRIFENKESLKDIIRNLKNQMMVEANQWYTQYSADKGKTLYRVQTVIPTKMWHNKMSLKPKEIRIINRLLAGHDYSKYWLAKMKITNNENCESCHEPETGRHKTFSCVRYMVERRNRGITLERFEKSFREKDATYLKTVASFVIQNRIEF
uniref:Putative outcast n=1 Tax=Anopheles darlingi TaxID=43151 RepID=A0A2M4CUE4_ANODA